MPTPVAPPVHRLPAGAYFSQQWFDREQVRLHARTWHRVDAEAALASADRLHVDTWEGLHFASAPTRAVACNWKLFFENHIDVLHLWYLHDESLAAFDHTRFEHHGVHRLFPDTPMATSASFFITYRAVAVGPEETRVELRVRAESDSDGDQLLAAARRFIEEDLDACVRVHRAVHSRHFAIGPLAHDHERPITAFHDHLLAILER